MAHDISLTDGTVTTPIDGGDITIVEPRGYALQGPTPAVTRQGAGGSDQTLTPHEWQNVTESINLMIRQTGAVPIRTTIQEIEGYLVKVRERQNTGMGPRVYLQAQLDDEADTWRSEILSGRLALDNPIQQLNIPPVMATLTITRRYFWEGPETQLDLASSEDGTPAGVVDVYNDDDATPAATNWIRIALADVAGVLPAPVKLRVKNDSGSSLSWREFYLATWRSAGTTPDDPFLLGSEAADGATFAWSTTSEEVAWRWTPTILTDARLGALAGRYYRVLAALASGSETDVYLRATVEVYVSGLPVVQYTGGRVFYSGDGLVDLGVVPLPPGGYDPLGSDVALRISAQKPAGGSSSMTLDFVQLTPAGDGRFQRIVQVGFAAPDQSAVVLDGIEGQYYYDDAGAHRAILRPRGVPLLIWPGSTNFIRLLFREADGFHAGRRMEVSAWYRPRRLSV